MQAVRGGDQHGLDVRVLEHRLQAGVGVLNFELRRQLAGARAIDIGHRQQLRLRDQAAQILRVLLSHLPHSQYSHP